MAVAGLQGEIKGAFLESLQKGVATTVVVAAPTKSRLLYADGLRGFAALMVVLFHLWIGAGSPSLPVRVGPLAPNVSVDLLSPIGALGGSRISLFFVLSGFLLYLPFARRDMGARENQNPSATKTPTLFAWLVRRLRRLAPAYYAAIPLALAPHVLPFYLSEMGRILFRHLPPRVPHFGPLFDAFPACLFFLHGLFPGSEAPFFNGPIWTLTPEIQLYVAFPLLIALARCRICLGKRRIGGLGIAVTLAVAASIAYRVWLYEQVGYAVWRDAGDLASPYHCLVNTFLGRWAEFALGMGASGAVLRKRLPSPYLLLPAFAFCMSVFLVLRSDLVIEGWVGRILLAMEPAPSPLADAVGGGAFALLLLCCAATPRVAQCFSSRYLIALGTVAYSLYLVHVPLLWWLHRGVRLVLHLDSAAPLGGANGSISLFALNVVIGLPLALFIARTFWRTFERPFLSTERKNTLIVSAAS